MTRKIIYIVSGLIVLLLLAAVLLPFLVDANKFKPQVESAAESALGRKVAIGNIRLALFSGGVSVEDIAISEDPKFGSGSFLEREIRRRGRGDDAADLFATAPRHRCHHRSARSDAAARRFRRVELLDPGRERRCLACRFIVF